jgi:chromosome segregation ATPase
LYRLPIDADAKLESQSKRASSELAFIRDKISALEQTVSSDAKAYRSSIEAQLAQLNLRVTELAGSRTASVTTGAVSGSLPLSADAIFPQIAPQIRDLINNAIEDKFEAQGATIQRLLKENERLKQQVQDAEAAAQSAAKEYDIAALKKQVEKQKSELEHVSSLVTKISQQATTAHPAPAAPNVQAQTARRPSQEAPPTTPPVRIFRSLIVSCID